MRSLFMHLRPVHVEGKRVQDDMKDLLSELMSRLPIQLHHHIEDFPIEKGIEDQLIRILQEAVSNTLRHAEANSMNITLIKREMFIILRIVKDGKDFKMKTANTESNAAG